MQTTNFEAQKLKDTLLKLDEVLENINLELKFVNQQLWETTDDKFEAELAIKYKRKRIEKAKDKPYFARIDFQDELEEATETCYIGKIGIMDYDHNIITVDWRTPIASLYYDSNIGKCSYQSYEETRKGKLLLKRQFDIEKGILRSYNDVDTVSNDDLLKPYLNVSADHRLKNIVASIQAEQNQIIRERLTKNLIIQGVAGSGKTTVALHRIAYLVYNYRDHIQNNQYMVIGPNKFFINYISSVLPDLDANDVVEYDLIEFAEHYLKETFHISNQRNQNSSLAYYKTSMKLKTKIDRFMNIVSENILPEEDLKIHDFKLISQKTIRSFYLEISPDQYQSIASRIERTILILSKYMAKIESELLDRLNEEIDQQFIQEKDPVKRDHLRKERDLIRKEIKNGCKNTIRKYFRKTNIPISKLYLSFLTFLNDPSFQETITKLKKKEIGREDLTPLMYFNYCLNGSGEFSKYRHVVIDEAQDYNTFTFYTLKKIMNNSTFSIYGDLAQSLYQEEAIQNWEEVLEQVIPDNGELMTLKKSYRTTIEIMEEANKINRYLHLDEAIPVIRHGNPVQYIETKDPIETIIHVLDQYKSTYQTIAIISETEEESFRIHQELLKRNYELSHVNEENQEYRGGICTINSQLSKGLEFDAVIISDASSDHFAIQNKQKLKLLYVSMTRPLHQLAILYQNQCHTLLK